MPASSCALTSTSSLRAMLSRDGRIHQLVRRAFEPFWVVPATWCVAAVILAVLLPRYGPDPSSFTFLLFPGDAEGARSFLSSIAGAMISVTGLVFSITIVVLQLASSQFSPRVLRTFLDDRIPQNTLGVFAASFLYALTLLRVVSGRDGSNSVPALAITLAFLLVLGSVAMFLAFIHHITNSVSVGTVLRQIGDETRTLLKRELGERHDLIGEVERPPALGRQRVVLAPRHGTVDSIDRVGLAAHARTRDARIEVLVPLGSFVPEGGPVALVHGGAETSDDTWTRLVCSGVGIARQRSLRQDVTFGLRQLVDIGERALSPGINDPTTAVQVIDELHDVLRRIDTGPDPDPVRRDDDGVARLVTRELTFAEALDLSVDELAHWGADSLQVPRRLHAMLEDLAVAVTPEHRDTVLAKQVDVTRRTRERS